MYMRIRFNVLREKQNKTKQKLRKKVQLCVIKIEKTKRKYEKFINMQNKKLKKKN